MTRVRAPARRIGVLHAALIDNPLPLARNGTPGTRVGVNTKLRQRSLRLRGSRYQHPLHGPQRSFPAQRRNHDLAASRANRPALGRARLLPLGSPSDLSLRERDLPSSAPHRHRFRNRLQHHSGTLRIIQERLRRSHRSRLRILRSTRPSRALPRFDFRRRHGLDAKHRRHEVFR